MKNGRSLTDLAAEIERRAAAKRDLMVPASLLRMSDNGLLVTDTEEHPLTERAHGQLAQYVDVPKAYYDRLRGEDPNAGRVASGATVEG